MNILSVASEVFPLIKTGGLADVAGALPIALAGHGMHMRTLMPGYPAVMQRLASFEVVAEIEDLLGEPARVLAATHEGLDILVLDAPAYYDRPGGPYVDATSKDFVDNWRRFAALSFAGAEIARGLLPDWRPDIVHAHDWQAAMTAVYMRYTGLQHIPTVVTVHNLAFQGQFGADIFPELALPPEAFTVDGLEYYGDVGYLKGGLRTAWSITTVSPTYAHEIMTPESIGLNQVQLNLTSRSGRAAVKHRMEEMGYKESDYNMDHLYDAFLKLADKKGQVFDYDLEALAFINKQQEEPEHFSLEYFSVQSGSSIMATASVKLKCGEEEKSEAATGNGPVDAVYQAINRITGYPIELVKYQLTAKGQGRDALGQVDIVVSYNGRRFHGVGLATDIVESSAKAMIHVLNNIWRSQQVEKEKQRLQQTKQQNNQETV